MTQIASLRLDEESKDRLTRESIAGLRAGHSTPHAAVRNWAESLNTAKPLPLPKDARVGCLHSPRGCTDPNHISQYLNKACESDGARPLAEIYPSGRTR